MKINSKNVFARYFRWIYGDLPKDICAFFWGSVSAILLAFIFVPGRIVGYFNSSKSFGNGLVFWICYALALIIGSIPVQWYLGVPDEELSRTIIDTFGGWIFIILPIAGAAFVLVLFAAIVTVIHLIVLLSVYAGTHPPESLHWVGAIRKKYCTKIDWEWPVKS